MPSLLVDQSRMHTTSDRHVGTMDLDVGLSLAIFDEQLYQELAKRLRHAGFGPDESENAIELASDGLSIAKRELPLTS